MDLDAMAGQLVRMAEMESRPEKAERLMNALDILAAEFFMCAAHGTDAADFSILLKSRVLTAQAVAFELRREGK